MASVNLGKVGLLLRGDWDSSTDYAALDVVSHEGYSYAARVANKNVEPSAETAAYWQPLAESTSVLETMLGYKNDAADSATAAAGSATAAATSASSATDALANEAADFSSSKAYAIGDYVIYDNGTHKYLYRFTAAHSAGAWVGTDAIQVALADDVSTLKRSTELYSFQLRRASVIEKEYVQWESGTLNSTTGADAADASDRQIRSGFLLAAPGEKIQFTGVSTNRLSIVCSYDKDKNFIDGSRKSIISGQSYTIPANTYYVRFIYGFTSGAGQTVTGYGGVSAVAADWDISCISPTESDIDDRVSYAEAQTLTDAQKVIARNNIGAADQSTVSALSETVTGIGTDLSDRVAYSAQTKSNLQKATARSNIGAAATEDVAAAYLINPLGNVIGDQQTLVYSDSSPDAKLVINKNVFRFLGGLDGRTYDGVFNVTGTVAGYADKSITPAGISFEVRDTDFITLPPIFFASANLANLYLWLYALDSTSLEETGFEEIEDICFATISKNATVSREIVVPTSNLTNGIVVVPFSNITIANDIIANGVLAVYVGKTGIISTSGRVAWGIGYNVSLQ